MQSVKGNQQGYGNNSDPITLNQYLYANANPISIADPTGHFGEEIIAGEGSDLNAYASDASIGEGAMGEAEDVVAEVEASSFEDTVVADEDLGMEFDSSYDSGQIQQDHPWSRAVRDALGLPADDTTQPLEALTNAYKGGEESQIVADIQYMTSNGMTQEQVLSVLEDELNSLANSGAGPNFPFGYGDGYANPQF